MLDEKTPLGVIRNYRGLKEINYLMTLEDFRTRFGDAVRDDMFSTHDKAKDWELFVGTLEALGDAEWATCSNDTMTVYTFDRSDTDTDLKSFLAGKYNDDMIEYVANNLEPGHLDEAENGCIAVALDWYWYLDEAESTPELTAGAKALYPELYKNATADHSCDRSALYEYLAPSLSPFEGQQLKDILAV